ncbi:M15 family metallopeptidase [Salinisphaera sp.]|uniref:M15 family metallopeptidase n=1 Tax=Salinisphaera sp. TaxID=1914330 RepID=UPI0025F94B11|nr:M15 family metallopeptidase [Salinisphaera sp.]
MTIIWIALYFLAALFALFLIIFPEGRRALGDGLRAAANRFASSGQSAARGARSGTGRAMRNGGRLARWFSRHRWIALAVVLLLTFPVLVVVQMQGLLDFNNYREAERESNPLVASLLRGERLAPPQPLPPEVFTTREVESVRPDLRLANRKWDRLKPEFAQILLQVYKEMRDKYGYRMVLIEGYRSPERQQRLKSKSGYVTNAGPYQSYHQFGLAADSAFLRNGKLVIAIEDDWTQRGYNLYGKLAEKYGLTWGGNWSFQDFGHVELHGTRYDDPSKHRR